jgi:hypothetical protein
VKTFLIVETQYQGHYLTGYIKYILRALPKKKFKIVILTTKKSKKKGIGAFNILRKENNKIVTEIIDDLNFKNHNLISLILYQIRTYFLIKNKFKKIHKKYNFCHVFVNSFQHFDKMFSILGSPFAEVKYSGIFLGPKFHLRNLHNKELYNFIIKFLFKRLISNKNLLLLVINDELLLNFIKKKGYDPFNKIKFLHDPKEFNYKFNKIYSRKRLNLPNKSFLILAYGAIINTKGIEELLKIFNNKNLNPQIKVVIAGEKIGSMLDYLDNLEVKKLIKNKKIFIFNGWQTEITESLLFSASDVVWIGYKNYYSPSGVLYQAVSINLPVITSNKEIIHWTNIKYKLGLSVDLSSTNDIVEKLNIIHNKFIYKKFQSNIKTFSKIASPDNWVDYIKRVFYKFL